MIYSIENSQFFNQAYRTFIHYTSRGISWIRSLGSHLYAKLPEIVAIAKRHLISSVNSGRALAWNYKELIIGGSLIGVSLLVIRYLWNHTPQYPNVSMETTLNYAKLSIKIPEGEPVFPNVTMAFCLDMSSSMTGEREAAVKRAVNNVLERGQKIIDETNEATIRFSIVGFNETSTVITPTTKLIPQTKDKENSPLTIVKKQIESIVSNGGTKILEGLEKTAELLEEMAVTDPNASLTLVFLTDGEDYIDQDRIFSLHQRLAALGVRLFALGIGDSHKKETLKLVSEGYKGEFKGTYIDTSLGEESIESVISKIFELALASFHELEISAPQLPSGSWSMLNLQDVKKNGTDKYLIPSLSEGEEVTKFIKIHGDQLKDPLDLRKVAFDLTFIDPKGRRGKISLPWKPHTIINPDIILAAKTAT